MLNLCTHVWFVGAGISWAVILKIHRRWVNQNDLWPPTLTLHIWRDVHIDRTFVYSFAFTKWLSGAFMMKMLAAERECERLYKQYRWCKTHRCARRILHTAHKWKCNVRRVGNDRLLLQLPLILHSEDVFQILWDRHIPFLWSERSIRHSRNPNEHSLMFSQTYRHSSDSELNPLSLLL